MLIIAGAAGIVYPHSSVIIKTGYFLGNAHFFAVEGIYLIAEGRIGFAVILCRKDSGADNSVLVGNCIHKARIGIIAYNRLLDIRNIEVIYVGLTVFINAVGGIVVNVGACYYPTAFGADRLKPFVALPVHLTEYHYIHTDNGRHIPQLFDNIGINASRPGAEGTHIS